MKAPIQPVNPATLEPLEPAKHATNAEIGEAVSEATHAMRIAGREITGTGHKG